MRPALRRQMYTKPVVLHEPTDEQLEAATRAVIFEAGKANDPKVSRDSVDPDFWLYAERYALAALMSYLNG